MLLLLCALACVKETPEQEYVDIRFGINLATRSALSVSDAEVGDLVLMAYSGGHLEAVSRDKSLRLRAGCGYNLYALANVPSFEAPAAESDLSGYEYCISDMSDLADGLPMSWRQSAAVFTASGIKQIELERLVTRISFSMDFGTLNGAQVSSVVLRQASSRVKAFGTASKAESSEDVIDGDYASEEDLAALNSGESLVLYALENCQGVLLPDNTDPWNKVPGNISESGLCTYIELCCQFQQCSPLEGEVTYRLYLGQDSCTDFSLLRNTGQQLSLKLTDQGLDVASWIVDNNSSYKSGLASIELVDGFHDVDGLYVGESVLLRLNISSELEAFWSDGRIENSSVVLGYLEDDFFVEQADCILVDGLWSEDGEYYFYLDALSTLDSSCQYNLYLLDDTGRLVTVLNSLSANVDEVAISPPYMLVGPLDEDGTSAGDPSSDPDWLSLVVNGDSEKLGLWLADADGEIFPNSGDWRFDPSCFTAPGAKKVLYSDMRDAVEIEAEDYIDEIADVFQFTSTDVYQNYPYPCLELEFSATNPGTDSYRNRALSLGLTPEAVVRTAEGLSVPALVLTLTMQDAVDVSIPCKYVVQNWQCWLLDATTECGAELEQISSNYDRTQLAVYNPSFVDLSVFQAWELHSSLPAVSGVGNRIQYFVNSESQMRDGVVSRAELELDASYAAAGESSNICYPAQIDGLDVAIYRIQYNNSNYCSMRNLYGCYTLMYQTDDLYLSGFTASDSGMMSEIWVSSLGTYIPDYEYCYDLVGETSQDISKYSYQGMNLWGESELISSADLQILGGHGKYDVKRVIDGGDADFNFYWDDSGNLRCAISNVDSRLFTITVKPTYNVLLYYTPDGGTTRYYQNSEHEFSTTASLYEISSETDSRLTSTITYASLGEGDWCIVERDVTGKDMALINRTYWMASASKSSYYDTQNTGRRHRWSTMAQPYDTELEISIRCVSDEDWLPVTLTLEKGYYLLDDYEFYAYTDEGTFAEYAEQASTNWSYARTNPDGGPRTNGAEGMPANGHCVLPDISSSSSASGVTTLTYYSTINLLDTNINRLAIY